MLNLRIPMLLSGIYITFTGLVLLFPAFASRLLDRPIGDPAIMSGAGSAILPIGLLAFAIALNVRRYGRLAWFFVLALGFGAANVIVYWLQGAYDVRTALLPVAVDIGLALWIFIALPADTPEEMGTKPT